MFTVVKKDTKQLLGELKGQDLAFYLGCLYLILYYLRPQYIYPQLNFLPWLQLTIILGLLAVVLKNKVRLKFQHALVFLFTSLVWLSVVNSQYPEISRLYSSPFILFLEVLFFSSTANNKTQLKILFIIFFLSIFKMSFFGARTWVERGFGFSHWGIMGPPGVFNNSGEFSLLMLVTFTLSIPFLVAFKPQTKLYWLLPVTCAMTILGASSRGNQLALIVVCCLFLLIYKKVKPKHLLYAGVFITALWTIFPEEQKERFTSAGQDGTSTARLAYWAAGIDMAFKNPWLGVGHKTFPEHYSNYYRDLNEGISIARKEVSHNSLVEVSANNGVPALVLYILILVYIFKSGVKKNQLSSDFIRQLDIGLKVTIIGYFISSFFMSVAFYPYIFLLISFRIMLINVNSAPEKSEEESSTHKKKLRKPIDNLSKTRNGNL
jgi:O-antigen ligase